MSLSPLAFGIMRLDHAGDAQAATRLIEDALELGVTTFHLSQEYETWPLFVTAWGAVRSSARQDVQIIAKIGAPHFGEAGFDPAAFRGKLDAYRTALGVEKLDVVQWLLRHDLKQEAGRAAIFDRDAGLIADTTGDLRATGAMGALVSFPYTRAIAERALGADWCDGLALYCNPLELEMVDLFDEAAEAGKSIIAIRPFAAGRLFSETHFSAEEAVSLPLSHPAVASVVASTSTPARLREAVGAARSATPGAARWRENLTAARTLLHV